MKTSLKQTKTSEALGEIAQLTTLLLFQKTGVQSPAPTSGLTIACSPSSRGSDTPFCHLWASAHIRT